MQQKIHGDAFCGQPRLQCKLGLTHEKAPRVSRRSAQLE